LGQGLSDTRIGVRCVPRVVGAPIVEALDLLGRRG
jgi:hypothetical protein